MTVVSASEFQRNFNHFQELAQYEPVMVTNNGKESVVLFSATEYTEWQKHRFAYAGKIMEIAPTIEMTYQNFRNAVRDPSLVAGNCSA